MSLLKVVKGVTQFEEVIRSEGVLIDFFATWSKSCADMVPLLEDIARTYAAEIWRLDVNKLPTIPQRYKVRNIPTLMVFSKGEPVGVKVGAVSRSVLFRFTMDHSEYLEDPFGNIHKPPEELQGTPKDRVGKAWTSPGASTMPLRGNAG